MNRFVLLFVAFGLGLAWYLKPEESPLVIQEPARASSGALSLLAYTGGQSEEEAVPVASRASAPSAPVKEKEKASKRCWEGFQDPPVTKDYRHRKYQQKWEAFEQFKPTPEEAEAIRTELEGKIQEAVDKSCPDLAFGIASWLKDTITVQGISPESLERFIDLAQKSVAESAARAEELLQKGCVGNAGYEMHGAQIIAHAFDQEYDSWYPLDFRSRLWVAHESVRASGDQEADKLASQDRQRHLGCHSME